MQPTLTRRLPLALLLLAAAPPAAAAQQDPAELQATAVANGALRVLGAPIRSHDNMAVAVDFAADGRCVSTAWDGTVRIWTLDASRDALVIRTGVGLMLFAQFCNDDASVVSADSEGNLVRWNAATGAEEARVTVTPRPGVGAASPDGRWLATAASSPAQVVIRDALSLEVAIELDVTTMPTCLTWSSDGRHLAVGGDRLLAVFDRETGQAVSRGKPRFLVQSIAVHADGNRLAVGSYDNVALFGFPELGDEPLASLGGFQTGVSGIQWTAADTVVFGDEDGVLAALDMAAEEFLWSNAEHRNSVPALAKSADGQVIASASRDHRVRFWNAADGSELYTAAGNRDTVQAIAFAPDGARVFGGDYGNVVAIHAADGSKPSRGILAHESSVIAVAPLGTDRVRSYGHDGVVRTLRASDGGQTAEVPLDIGADTSISVFAFAPNGGWAGCYDGQIRRFDLDTGALVGEPLDQGSPIQQLAVAPNGERIAAVGEDGGVTLWSADGKVVATLVELAEESWLLAFAGNGLLAGTQGDGLLRIWDAATGEPRHSVALDADDPVQAIAGAPDGSRIVTAHPGKIRVWSCTTGTAERSTAAFVSVPSSAAFSADGGRLAVGMLDGTILVWKIDALGAGEQD